MMHQRNTNNNYCDTGTKAIFHCSNLPCRLIIFFTSCVKAHISHLRLLKSPYVHSNGLNRPFHKSNFKMPDDVNVNDDFSSDVTLKSSYMQYVRSPSFISIISLFIYNSGRGVADCVGFSWTGMYKVIHLKTQRSSDIINCSFNHKKNTPMKEKKSNYSVFVRVCVGGKCICLASVYIYKKTCLLHKHFRCHMSYS